MKVSKVDINLNVAFTPTTCLPTGVWTLINANSVVCKVRTRQRHGGSQSKCQIAATVKDVWLLAFGLQHLGVRAYAGLL